MKKTLSFCILLFAFCIFVTACGKCEHTYDNACDATCNECGETREVSAHQWKDATCTTLKTCTVCKATEGEALGHTWVDADCDTPKTCSACGASEGEALGHAWVDADCDTPKTCSVCGASEGEAVGHAWVDADCDTPKTCSVCGASEGEALGHAWVDADCDTPKTCSACGTSEGEALGHSYENDYVISAEGHYQKCICHPELDAFVPHVDEDDNDVCDDCAYEYNCDYTVHLDREHASVKIEFINLSTGHKHTVDTDDSGVAIANLPKGDYSINVIHYNSGYIWLDKDNNIVLTEENNTYNATFEITTDRIEYVITIYDSAGNKPDDGIVLVYTSDAEVEGALGINSRSQAITYMYNGDYTLSIYADGCRKTISFVKDGPTSATVYMDNSAAPGTEENPMLLYDLAFLPYNNEFIAGLPFDNSYDFEAGESVYLLLPYAYKKTVSLGTDKLMLEYGGVVRQPNADGAYDIEAEYGESVILKLTAIEACTEDIRAIHLGSRFNPIYVNTSNLDGYSMTCELVAGESIYFMFVADSGSYFDATTEGCIATLNGDAMINTPVEGYNELCITAIEAGTYEIVFTYTSE